MSLATGQGSVAREVKNSWSAHILSKHDVLLLVPILNDKNVTLTQPNGKILILL